MKKTARERERARIVAILHQCSPNATDEHIDRMTDLNIRIAESRRTSAATVQAEVDQAKGVHIIDSDSGIKEATGFGYAEQISTSHWEAHHNGMWATVKTKATDTEGVVQIVSIKVRR